MLKNWISSLDKRFNQSSIINQKKSNAVGFFIVLMVMYIYETKDSTSR